MGPYIHGARVYSVCMLRVCVDVWMDAIRTCTDLEEQTDVLTMLHEVGAILYAQTGLLEYVFRT